MLDIAGATYSIPGISKPLSLEFRKVDLLIDLEHDPNFEISKEDEPLLKELISTGEQELLDIIEQHPDSKLAEKAGQIQEEQKVLEASRERAFEEDNFLLNPSHNNRSTSRNFNCFQRVI